MPIINDQCTCTRDPIQLALEATDLGHFVDESLHVVELILPDSILLRRRHRLELLRQALEILTLFPTEINETMEKED